MLRPTRGGRRGDLRRSLRKGTKVSFLFMGDDPRSHESRPTTEVQPARDADLDAISRAVGAKPLASLDELALDVWESDEELARLSR